MSALPRQPQPDGGSPPAPAPWTEADRIARLSDPERFGWLYGSFWLVFLAFPLHFLLTSDRSAMTKAVGVVLIATFAAVDVLGNRRLGDICDTDVSIGWRYLAILTALALAATSVWGAHALSFAPYLCAWAMLSLPLPVGVGVTATWLALSVATALIEGNDYLQYPFIIVGVAVITGAAAFFARAGAEANELRLRAMIASDQERIARDVHDVLGHSLTAVVVKSELAQRLIDTDPDAARREMTEVEELSRRALAEVRATVGGLRATRFADEVEVARQLLDAAGITVELRGQPDQVDPGSSVVLGWAVREGATNIVRHSGANVAVINCGADWLEITDDGRGMVDADSVTTGGNGLAGLRERVAAMGGTVSVGSGRSGVGTRLRIDAGTVR